MMKGIVAALCAIVSVAAWGQPEKQNAPKSHKKTIVALELRVQQDAVKLAGLEKRIESLTATINTASEKQQALMEQVNAVRTKLDESAWKALDATTKLSNLQWQLWSFFLALIAAISLGGWKGFKLLRDKLENEIKSSIDQHENVLQYSSAAMVFGWLSFGFWNQSNTVSEANEKKRLLDAATFLSGFALDHADRLDPFGLDKYEELITNIRANHAYFLAAHSDPSDPTKPNMKNAEAAFRLAKSAFQVASKYMKGGSTKHITKWPDWVESYCWVLTRFGDEGQKASAKQIIKTVCDDVRVDEAWRRQIRSEYSV